MLKLHCSVIFISWITWAECCSPFFKTSKWEELKNTLQNKTNVKNECTASGSSLDEKTKFTGLQFCTQIFPAQLFMAQRCKTECQKPIGSVLSVVNCKTVREIGDPSQLENNVVQFQCYYSKATIPCTRENNFQQVLEYFNDNCIQGASSTINAGTSTNGMSTVSSSAPGSSSNQQSSTGSGFSAPSTLKTISTGLGISPTSNPFNPSSVTAGSSTGSSEPPTSILSSLPPTTGGSSMPPTSTPLSSSLGVPSSSIIPSTQPSTTGGSTTISNVSPTTTSGASAAPSASEISTTSGPSTLSVSLSTTTIT